MTEVFQLIFNKSKWELDNTRYSQIIPNLPIGNQKIESATCILKNTTQDCDLSDLQRIWDTVSFDLDSDSITAHISSIPLIDLNVELSITR